MRGPLAEALTDRDWSRFRSVQAGMHVQDVAEVLAQHPADVWTALSAIQPERWPAVLAYLDPDLQYRLLVTMEADAARRVLAGLLPDDLTALLAALPDNARHRLLGLLPASQVRSALKQLGYPEESAGRLMNTRFVSVRGHWTLAQALEHLRRRGETGDTINTLYVTDPQRHLIGTVGLKRLILARQDRRVRDLVNGELVTVDAADDREHAARMIQKYDITALPVVDREGVLLGVITVDDVLDVLEEESTEDFHKLGGVAAVTLSLRDARPLLLYRKRIGWLVLLVLMNVVGGSGIALFEDTLERAMALVLFLPLIIGSGGNAGAQSATLMVRALATGDVQMRHWLSLWGKEVTVAAALGATMGLAVWGVGLWRGGPDIALTVSLAMLLVVLVGSMIGLLLPFVLVRLKLDPATASAPLVTSVADIIGILIYLAIATVLVPASPGP